MNFDEVILMQEQEDLLVTVVEASRKVPKEQRRQFLIISTSGGYTLLHDGLSGNMLIQIGDVQALSEERLLTLSYSSNGKNRVFDVTARGYKFYEHLKTESERPLEEMSNDMKRYLDANSFRSRYPKAYEKWNEAQSRLWSSESKKELTTIGHLCRESMQEFADDLVKIHKVADASANKSSTVNRIKSVLNQKNSKLGKTRSEFLHALIPFWGTVSDLVQRQEHGAERENESLKWEDARLVTFQTMVVMYEIDRAIENT